MKLTKLFMLAMIAVIAIMALASCGGNNAPTEIPGDNTSSSEQGSTEPQLTTYTVTFHYGIQVWGEGKDRLFDTPDEYAFTHVAQIEVAEGEIGSLANEDFPTDDPDNLRGYKYEDWIDETGEVFDEENISADMDVYAAYRTLELYTYTFKNANGEVISTGSAYEGESLAKLAPATDGVPYFAEADIIATELSDYKEYITIEDVKYFVKADQWDRLKEAVAMEVGYMFERWESDKTASTVNRLTANNTTFTAVLSKSDETIKYVAAGTISKDNMLTALKNDAYKLEHTFYKYILSSKVEGINKNTDCSILDKYADKAAAIVAEEGDEWQRAYDIWNIPQNGISADFYMAWDGEYVYFLADVKDPKVVTLGKTYCTTLDNPYENDAVEVWYGIGGKYHKICLDACGYKLFTGKDADGPSAYIQYIRDEGLAQAAVKKGSATVDVSSGEAKIVAEGSDSGYTVAFAFPAYEEPDDIATFDQNDKATWGRQLTRGSAFYLSLQIDNISAPAEQSVIDSVVGQGAIGSGINNGSSDEMREAIGRINLGWQVINKKSTESAGALKLCLG